MINFSKNIIGHQNIMNKLLHKFKNNKRFYTIDATKSITSISEQIIKEFIKLND